VVARAVVPRAAARPVPTVLAELTGRVSTAATRRTRRLRRSSNRARIRRGRHEPVKAFGLGRPGEPATARQGLPACGTSTGWVSTMPSEAPLPL
jgi:hypothetical protein